MKNLFVLIILSMAVFVSPFMTGNAGAYIDPGTTSVVFSALAYVLSGAAIVLAFFIRPVRNWFKSLKNRFKKEEKTGSTHFE